MTTCELTTDDTFVADPIKTLKMLMAIEERLVVGIYRPILEIILEYGGFVRLGMTLEGELQLRVDRSESYIS
jgi:hypothetical protein